ncbi:MAG: tetratricopeptide repeat protein [Negativicutes bacterium]|nr:tetratricopeptide repeat protein [Negativicutes bacterium]
MQLMPYPVIVQALADNDIAKIQKGRKTCLAILKHSPDHLICLRLIAEIDYQAGRFEQAEKWLGQALKLEPDSEELNFNYALTLVKQKKYAEALAVSQHRVRTNPHQAEAFFHLGIIYEEAGQRTDAIAAYQTALQLAPDDIESLHRLGTALMTADKLAEAEQCFRRIIALDPNDADALNCLGNIANCQGQFDHSIAFYKQALALRPNYPIPLGNLATALESAGKLTEAIAVYRQSIALDPECLKPQFNLALSLLANGQMDEGWRAFEKRTELIQLFADRQEITKPLWRGEAGNGQTVLIRAEQGYGDTIQFCRYMPLVAARGYQVILEVQPPLVRLLTSLSGPQQVVAYGDPLPAVDYYCPLMSLPFVFHTQLETIPDKIPYLTVPKESRDEWQQRMPAAEHTPLKVGIAWAGKQRNASLELAVTDRRRSIDPSLFAPLLAVPGIQFYSLQKMGPEAPAEFAFIDMMAECDDFSDTAALIMNLDLVISVDTAVAHLAGALGKKVWLLNRFDSCWRWLRLRDDSPWYPTLRIFRQPQPGDWHSVILSVQKELKKSREEVLRYM